MVRALGGRAVRGAAGARQAGGVVDRRGNDEERGAGRIRNRGEHGDGLTPAPPRDQLAGQGAQRGEYPLASVQRRDRDDGREHVPAPHGGIGIQRGGRLAGQRRQRDRTVVVAAGRHRPGIGRAEHEQHVEEHLTERDRQRQAEDGEASTGQEGADEHPQHPRHDDAEPSGHRTATGDVGQQRDECRDGCGDETTSDPRCP